MSQRLKKETTKTMIRHYIFKPLLIFVLGTFFSCKEDDSSITNTTTSTKPNILLIIADDMGKDATSDFSEGTLKPNTPNINALKREGVTFTNFWVNPTCTPTRSSIITGKYGYRTDVKAAGDVLATSETILQKYIKGHTNDAYASAIIGKWHLSGANSNFNPEIFGLDKYAGLISGSTNDYYNWTFTENGKSELETEYITTQFTDLAIDWVKEQEKNWFLWLAYTAPHTPFHVPPANTHSQGSLLPYSNGVDPLPYYLAAIESMDFQIGRLLDSIPSEEKENTVVIFLGDNGTPNQAAQAPYKRNTVKGTLYQGGINTPLIVSGKGVSRRALDHNLINGVDLFATIANLAGISINELHDSKNFTSLLTSSAEHRNFQYSEIRDGNTDSWAIRNDRYKLIVKPNGEEMYDLINDPYEGTNLLSIPFTPEIQDAKSALEDELAIIRK